MSVGSCAAERPKYGLPLNATTTFLSCFDDCTRSSPDVIAPQQAINRNRRRRIVIGTLLGTDGGRREFG